MSLIRTAKRLQHEADTEIITYKEVAAILGLAPKTVLNGGAGTSKLRIPWGPGGRMVRYNRFKVQALRDEWLRRAE